MKKIISLFFILIILIFSLNISIMASVEQPISFLQDDTEWGSESYSIVGSQSQTIATSGCGPTSMAMVLNYYIDESITPLQTSIFALKNNHRTRYDGTSWTYFEDMANEYDLEFLQTASSVEALEWMNNSDDPLIICSMGPGLWTTEGHFIVLWDVEDGIAYINDPASTESLRTENSYDYMASQCMQYFCFDKPFIFKSYMVSFITNNPFQETYYRHQGFKQKVMYSNFTLNDYFSFYPLAIF